jgi:Tfp pilus assembly protein FimT
MELMLVLTLAALVISISVLGFSRLQKNMLFKSALRDIQGALRRGKLIALSERMPVAFKCSKSAFWLQRAGSNGRIMQMPRGSEIKKATPIVFFPKGDSTGGYLLVRGPDGKEFIIEVDRITGTPGLVRP